MGALVAILQSDPNLLRCQVARLDAHVSLVEGDRLPDAYGFGHYGGGSVLLGKRPTGAAHALGLRELVGQLDSEALLVHARCATVGKAKDENTHPFRFRRWLFAHDGTVEGFDRMPPAARGGAPGLPSPERDGRDRLGARLHVVPEAPQGRGAARRPRPRRGAPRRAPSPGRCGSSRPGAARRRPATEPARPRRDERADHGGDPARRTAPLRAHRGDRALRAPRRGPAHPRERPAGPPSPAREGGRLRDRLRTPNGFIEVPDGSVVAVTRTLQVSVSRADERLTSTARGGARRAPPRSPGRTGRSSPRASRSPRARRSPRRGARRRYRTASRAGSSTHHAHRSRRIRCAFTNSSCTTGFS